jgi:putative ABC transport system permease protein
MTVRRSPEPSVSDVLSNVLARVYGVALRLCPRRLRGDYGDDMRLTFEARCREAAARGGAAVIILAIYEFADLGIASVRGRRNARFTVRSADERRPLLTGLSQDARYGLRMLRRQPSFTATAVITLALGIGAATAVFTVVNGVLLRPLAYGHPQEIVALKWGRPDHMSPWFSPLNFLDLTKESGAFSQSAAYAPVFANLTGLGEPERLAGASVTWNFFDVLQTPAIHGRTFVADDAKTPDPNVIVLSDGLWRRGFGGRRDAIGATVQLDGRKVTIVGVAPVEVKLPPTAEFWQPLVFSPHDVAPRSRGAQWVMAVARLKHGVVVEQANAALATVAARLAADFPNTNGGTTSAARPLHQQIVGNIRPTLLVMLGAVTLVLLIACVNVANLLLARAQGRVREVAMRAALGAGRRRLVQQFLAESLLLGALGAFGGLLVAYGCLQTLVALGPASIPRLAEISIDVRVLAFTIALAVGTSLLFGLAPAIAATSTGDMLARLVAAAGRASTGGGARTRKILVVCEMALAVVLLIAAGLLMRSYASLQRVDPGFNPDGILTASISLPAAKYPTPADDGRFTSALVDRLASAPGVDAAAAAFGLPFSVGFNAHTSFTRRGEVDSADTPGAGMRIVTPEYFRTLSIPLRAGRVFDGHDNDSGTEVVIINQEAARRFWPDRNPLGEQIHVSVRLSEDRSGQKTIVGVVGDVKYGGLDAEPMPEIYLPYAQHRVDSFTVALRAKGDPAALAPVLRRELAALDRELPAADLQPMTSLIGSSVAERRFTMLLLVAFAAVAVALATIGIYGVLAYVVGQRTREIGVRLAIGAAPRDVVGLVLREGMLLAGIGLACGLTAAVGATRALASLLYGVTATDAATFIAVAVALGTAALLASYVPARRAARVDPMQALRTE